MERRVIVPQIDGFGRNDPKSLDGINSSQGKSKVYHLQENKYRNAWCRFRFFRNNLFICNECNLLRFEFFELIKAVMEEIPRGTFF